MRNILITGSNGQLGSEFKIIENRYPAFNLFFTDIDELDITNLEQVNHFIKQNNINDIVNCAAYTNVDKAETESELAHKINAIGPDILAKSAKANNCRLVHISTDYVFDGSKNVPYKENDKIAPIGVYGQTKLEGEQNIINSNTESIIIRTSWLYSSFGNNFVKTMLKYGLIKDELNVINDQVGTPTYAQDLALSILEILKTKETLNLNGNIYHYSNLGVSSWYDFAYHIIQISKTDCNVNAIETKDYPSDAVRPSYSVLNKQKIIHDFGIKIPYWRDSLISCINLIHKEQ